MTINKTNLRALAKLLREIADPSHFNMEWFLARDDDAFDFNPSHVKSRINECGTVACAIGHAPLLFPAEEGETWDEYSKRVFGLSRWECDKAHLEVWDFLFSGCWRHFDNTPTGAANRIDYYLRTDKVLPTTEDSVARYS